VLSPGVVTGFEVFQHHPREFPVPDNTVYSQLEAGATKIQEETQRDKTRHQEAKLEEKQLENKQTGGEKRKILRERVRGKNTVKIRMRAQKKIKI